MIRARVSNFRGCERAEIVLDPIALVAGRNAAGKSSLAQAVGAALTGDTLAAKTNAGVLVMSGASQGTVEIAEGEGIARITWPACDVTASGDPPRASAYAAGLATVATMAAKDRAQVLSQYLGAAPTREDLTAALHDADLGDEDIIAAVWKLIDAQGWDGAHQERRDKGVELKGRWRQITNHNWGSRIGLTWRPAGWTANLDEASEPDLVAAVAAAKLAHDKAIGAAAISAARRDEMAAEAAELDPRKDTLRDFENALDKFTEALAAAKANRAALKPGHVDTGMPCPHCGAFVVLRRVNLAESRLEPAEVSVPESELKTRRLAIADAEGEISRLEGEVAAATTAVEIARARMQQAAEAANKLAMFPPPAGDDTAAATALEAAEARLNAWRLTGQAADIHARIASNDRLLGILAGDGLRAQKLARVLDLFNRTLAGYCEAADWQPVTLAADMAISYGGRLYTLCSTSEQYRSRAVLAVAMARIDQSAMVVLDAADVLDGTTRSGLFALLAEAGLPALVTLTLTRREQMPDLAAAELGASYWLADGVTHSLTQVAEAAA